MAARRPLQGGSRGIVRCASITPHMQMTREGVGHQRGLGLASRRRYQEEQRKERKNRTERKKERKKKKKKERKDGVQEQEQIKEGNEDIGDIIEGKEKNTQLDTNRQKHGHFRLLYASERGGLGHRTGVASPGRGACTAARARHARPASTCRMRPPPAPGRPQHRVGDGRPPRNFCPVFFFFFFKKKKKKNFFF